MGRVSQKAWRVFDFSLKWGVAALILLVAACYVLYTWGQP